MAEIIDATLKTTLDGTERLEIQEAAGGTGSTKQTTSQAVSELAVTREFSRAWSSELLFDKNEVDTTPHTLTGDTTYTIAVSGNLVNQFASIVQEVIVDGVLALNFSGFQYIWGITNGEVKPAGRYIISFLYSNGRAMAQWHEPSLEGSSSVQLQAPPNFMAVGDGETEIDLTWDDVANNDSYLIEVSDNGISGWSTLSTPTADQVSASQTGLTAGTTKFYRIKAVGNGTSFIDSAYSTASATTEDAGDVTAPTFTFDPVDGATEIGVTDPITITADEPIRKAD